MNKILLEGPILSRSGYGEHARIVYESIKSLSGVDVYISPLEWGTTSWNFPDESIIEKINKYSLYIEDCKKRNINPDFDTQIHVGIPNEFQKKAKYSVCVTAGIETDRVSPEWLVRTHQGIDKIIVPSEHSRKGFVETKYQFHNKADNTTGEINCACPVDVVCYPTKDPQGKKIEIDFETDFNFLSVALMGPRKNLEFTIRGFVEQFRENPNVGLVLKTGVSKSSVIDRANTHQVLRGFVDSLGPKKCKVYLIHGNLSESELHSLYVHPKIKAYVSTSHGEGYGLPIFEAAYSGLPVLATDWSGHLDFLTGTQKGKQKKLFAKISYELKNVQTEAVWDTIITKDSKWAFPSKVSYKTQLEKVYSNHGMYKKWAKTLKLEISKKFSKDSILQQMKDSLGIASSEEVDSEIESMFASLSE